MKSYFVEAGKLLRSIARHQQRPGGREEQEAEPTWRRRSLRIALCALRMGAPALMVRMSFLPGWTWSVFQVLRSLSGFDRYTKSFLGLHHGGPIVLQNQDTLTLCLQLSMGG